MIGMLIEFLGFSKQCMILGMILRLIAVARHDKENPLAWRQVILHMVSLMMHLLPESLKRNILGWIAVFVFLFTPLWWKTTTVYRAPLPFDRMNALHEIKFRIEIELKYPKKINSLETLLTERLKSNNILEFSFARGKSNAYNFEIQCIKGLSSIEIFIAQSRSVLISIPDSDCLIENVELVTMDAILDLFDSNASDDESINTLKFSKNYQVTWSLLNGDPTDSIVTWDIENSVNGKSTRNQI